MESWQVQNKDGWHIMVIVGRIDAFNFAAFSQELKAMSQTGAKLVAVDLSQAKFLSLPAIKFLGDLALDLSQNGGRLALLKPSEKLKRQIDIYSSLAPMRVVRSPAELGG